jgi:hypothetical protein
VLERMGHVVVVVERDFRDGWGEGVRRRGRECCLWKYGAGPLGSGQLPGYTGDYSSSGSATATAVLGFFGRGLIGAGFQAKGSPHATTSA